MAYDYFPDPAFPPSPSTRDGRPGPSSLLSRGSCFPSSRQHSDPVLHAALSLSSQAGYPDITAADGTDLPASDQIDYIDYSMSVDPTYTITSVNMTTGGGDIGTLTVANEEFIVPEPAALTLLGSALLVIAGADYLRRRREGMIPAIHRSSLRSPLRTHCCQRRT